MYDFATDPDATENEKVESLYDFADDNPDVAVETTKTIATAAAPPQEASPQEASPQAASPQAASPQAAVTAIADEIGQVEQPRASADAAKVNHRHTLMDEFKLLARYVDVLK